MKSNEAPQVTATTYPSDMFFDNENGRKTRAHLIQCSNINGASLADSPRCSLASESWNLCLAVSWAARYDGRVRWSWHVSSMSIR